MSRTWLRLLALMLAAAGGLVAAGATGLLITGYAKALRQAPRNKAVLARLDQISATNPAEAPALEAERHHQMMLSVARDARNKRLAWVLLASAAVFLIGGKWYVRLGRRRVPDMFTVLTVRGVALPVPASSRTETHVLENAPPAAVDLAA